MTCVLLLGLILQLMSGTKQSFIENFVLILPKKSFVITLDFGGRFKAWSNNKS